MSFKPGDVIVGVLPGSSRSYYKVEKSWGVGSGQEYITLAGKHDTYLASLFRLASIIDLLDGRLLGHDFSNW